MNIYDLIIVGAGPCGLACGIEAQQNGLSYLIIDKGSITESIRRYPTNMTFFSTSENIEIGNVPFVSMGMRPTRTEALKYYRKVTEHCKLNLKLFTRIESIRRREDHFEILAADTIFHARKLILATGYYDVPRFLNVPGEDLPHVSHYYDEAYKYTRMKVVVVGGANSAIESSLDLYRNGADVTLVHKYESLDHRAKYWIVPDLENRIKKEEVEARFNCVVKEITNKHVKIENLKTGKTELLEADFVFLMTGYRPDAKFLGSAGIRLEGEYLLPVLHEDTLESNVDGIYLAGSIVGGEETAKVFIENGKLHALPIIADIKNKLRTSG